MAYREDCDCDEVKVKVERSGTFGALLRGIFWGGLLGAGAVLLSTPRSGPEMRNMLRDRSMDLRDQAMDKVSQARDKATDLVQRGAHVVNQQKSMVGSKVEGVKEGVKEGVRTYQTTSQEPDEFSDTTTTGTDIANL